MSSAASVRSQSTLKAKEDDRSTLKQPDPPSPTSFRYQFLTEDGEGEEEASVLANTSYSSQLESILGQEGDADEGMSDEDDFVYTGRDASPLSGGYHEQMAEILGEDGEFEKTESGAYGDNDQEDEFRYVARSSSDDELSEQMSSAGQSRTSSLGVLPSAISGRLASKRSTNQTHSSFLHPTISRLRSFTPHQHRVHTSSSIASNIHNSLSGVSPSPSRISSISRASSLSNLQSVSGSGEQHQEKKKTLQPQNAFRWTDLRVIGSQIFSTKSQKASAVLGSSWGNPTVMAANGLICIGTDQGQAVIFDFKQQLKSVCLAEQNGKSLGAATALALSHDRTFLAVGYEYGHINLFDLSKPQTPARSVPPTTITSVASGRKEGHLQGSRVNHLGFVGSRHTAIVSADENGLAFYHSLGKVLFIEANDVLRLLGKYPEERPIQPASEAALPRSLSPINHPDPFVPAFSSIPSRSAKKRGRPISTILAMAPLPLGTTPHPTDSYHLTALLTPIKLVIVGLKPAPRTWFRRHREVQEGYQPRGVHSQWRGCLAWYPCVSLHSSESQDIPEKPNSMSSKNSSLPLLVYSWGKAATLVKVREEKVLQKVIDDKLGGGKEKLIEVGRVVFDEVHRWETDMDVVAIQWLNTSQILVLTLEHLEVFEIRATISRVERVPLDARTLLSFPLSTEASELRLNHSLKVYKGKLFLLGQQELRAGTLLSWADRILSFVQEGDFLSAIELTRCYYVGEAPGNKNGLPDDPVILHRVVGQKLRDLMAASASYAFSDERMTDGTHYTPDGRGVDRTALFEGLVTTCVQASVAMNDFDFLYEDLFEKYSSSGIVGVFLTQLEPFILDGSVTLVPPYVTQKLVAMHEEKGNYDKAEKIIWHIHPASLDVNQAITLCQRFELYDALIYVYTQALRDFVSPFVELLGLVRKVQQRRREHGPYLGANDEDSVIGTINSSVERLVPNAHKVFAYLANILSGLTYPSEKPMSEELALRAKKDLYPFIFYGRSSVWPAGSGGKLVLTADEEGGTEPTYPYLRLLLKFDAEAFLHSMDIAFEDAYLNDMGSQGVVSRQIIINVLLEIVPSPDFSNSDTTFINIFIARNVPKYPQFIHITPSALQSILMALAQDMDSSTREDRQLAAEFLLSVYTPHNRDRLLVEFERAGFYRIVRSWYRKEEKWSHILSTFLHDPDLDAEDLFFSIGDVLSTATRRGRTELPPELKTIAVDSLPQFLELNIINTAYLVDTYFPESHQTALQVLRGEDRKQFLYLQALIQPNVLDGQSDHLPFQSSSRAASLALDQSSRHHYISLACRLDPETLIPLMETLPEGYVDPDETVLIAQETEVFDVVVWLLNRQLKLRQAFDVISSAGGHQAAQLAECLASVENKTKTKLQSTLLKFTSMIRMGIRVCLEHSKDASRPHQKLQMEPEDMWFHLLRGQIEAVQLIAAVISSKLDHPASIEGNGVSLEQYTLDFLRNIIQETFSSLVSQTSYLGLSFPLLFKRLVDSTSMSRAANKGLYAEFRLILTGMLESYRFEGDFLTLSKRLVERDLYETLHAQVRSRRQGWRPNSHICSKCGLRLLDGSSFSTKEGDRGTSLSPKIAFLRSGTAYHLACNTATTVVQDL